MESRSRTRLGQAGPSANELELLRAALLVEKDDAAAAWRRWRSAQDLDHASGYEFALLGAVAANLPNSVLGADADRMAGLRRRAWAQSQYHLRTLSAALGALEPLADAPIVIKGTAMLLRDHHVLGTRWLADVDLLVAPDEFDRALALLTAEGWSSTLEPSSIPSWVHGVRLVHPDHADLDLHRWCMFPRYSPRPDSTWADSTSAVTIGERPVRLLCPADELVLTIAHGILGGGPSMVRWPIDIRQLITVGASAGHDRSFWDEVVGASREHRQTAVVGDSLRLAREFDLDVPEWVLADLAIRSWPERLLAWRARCGRSRNPNLLVFFRVERTHRRWPNLWTYARLRMRRLVERGPKAVIQGRVAAWRTSRMTPSRP